MKPALDIAIDAISKRGTLRTPALAETLGIGEAAVDAMLAPACRSGRLTTCTVEVGGRRVMEYRCSVSGGRYEAFRIAPTPAPARAAAPTAPPPGEEEQMNLADSITAAFKEHGPMTIGQLSQHVTHEDLPDMVRQLAERGALAKLGGKTRGIIYGLPDQELSERREETAADAPPPAPKRKKGRKNAAKKAAKKARKQRVKRIGRAVAKAAAKKAWATRRAKAEADQAIAKASSFRPAIAADGALLLLGAEKGTELNKDETKVLVAFIRSLDKGEVAA